MKRFFLTLTIALMGIGVASAQNIKLTKQAVGVQFLHSSSVNNLGVGAYYQHLLPHNLRIEGGLDYVFKKSNTVGLLQVNANLQYLFHVGPVYLYPLAGLTLATATGSGADYTRLGVNLGGGVEYPFTNDLSVKGEVKYAFLKNYDPTTISVGLSYHF